MALTRSFVETIKERAEKDPKFRIGLLTEAAECFLNGDMETGKTLLRDYVNATIGFPELAKQLDKKPESLMRMLSAKGNPRADNLSQLLSSLRRHEGIELHVAAGR
jgi:DNA-binding phage protein